MSKFLDPHEDSREGRVSRASRQPEAFDAYGEAVSAPAKNPSGEPLWTGRATNRGQWLLSVGGAACLALGIKLAVDYVWTGDIAPLVMSVVGCIAAGLLVLAGTLAFVH